MSDADVLAILENRAMEHLLACAALRAAVQGSYGDALTAELRAVVEGAAELVNRLRAERVKVRPAKLEEPAEPTALRH